MSLHGAFRGTARRLAGGKFFGGRADVNPNLTKWWKKHVPTNGEVIRHLSPYETTVVNNWFKTWPETASKRGYRILVEGGPGLALLVGLMWWADATHHHLAEAHRD